MSPKEYYRLELKKINNFLSPKETNHLYIGTVDIPTKGTYGWIILDNIIGNIKDLQTSFAKVKKLCKKDTRVVITYYNQLWAPFLKLASFLGLRSVKHEQSWLDDKDISNILNLTVFETVTTQKRFLLPIYIPYISNFINSYVAHLPLFNSFCLITFVVAKPKPIKYSEYSVSIIVPPETKQGMFHKSQSRFLSLENLKKLYLWRAALPTTPGK